MWIGSLKSLKFKSRIVSISGSKKSFLNFNKKFKVRGSMVIKPVTSTQLLSLRGVLKTVNPAPRGLLDRKSFLSLTRRTS